jgi:nicotinamide mononucleotide adenylyltransferase|tara:strand:- start:631 stop:858 length:228 start_codon:yes stop_codon:yes gene_type:complete
MTDSKESVVSIDDKEYSLNDLDANQRYLLVQIQDVTNNIRSLNMKVEQAQAALTVFKDTLVRSVKETDDTNQNNS